MRAAIPIVVLALVVLAAPALAVGVSPPRTQLEW